MCILRLLFFSAHTFHSKGTIYSYPFGDENSMEWWRKKCLFLKLKCHLVSFFKHGSHIAGASFDHKYSPGDSIRHDFCGHTKLAATATFNSPLASAMCDPIFSPNRSGDFLKWNHEHHLALFPIFFITARCVLFI